MRHAFHGIGPFKGLTEDEIGKRVSRLVGIIKDHALVRVSITARWSDYVKHYKGKVRVGLPKEIDHPYFLCFHGLVYSIACHASIKKWQSPVDIVFDEQGKLGDETKKWYRFVKKNADPSIKPYLGGPPIFRDDSKFLPLQAADLFAWSIRRHLWNNKIIHVPMRSELRSLQSMEAIEQKVDPKAIISGMIADEMTISLPKKKRR
jgi:hypothetical protein